MAVCLRNTGTTPLRIDLSTGESLWLQPGADSPPLREEQLYFNAYLTDWERRGWLVRVPVKMAEVLKHEKSQRETVSGGVVAAAARGPRVRAAGATKPDEAEEAEEADANDEDRDSDVEAELDNPTDDADADADDDIDVEADERARSRPRGKKATKRGTSGRKK